MAEAERRCTISTMSSNKVSLRHNFEKSFRNNEDNVDENLQIETLCYAPLEDVYDNLFGDSLEAYNGKCEAAHRPGRKISSYLGKVISEYETEQKEIERAMREEGKVLTAKKTPPVRELIFGVYHSDLPENELRQIYHEAFKEFQKENPNLKIVGAVIHWDEPEAKPHLHIDYVPFCDDNKKGMRTQVSMSGALRQMGLTDTYEDENGIVKKDRGHALAAWDRKNNLLLESICEEHNLSVEHPERDEEQEHLDTPQYKRVMDRAKKDAKKVVDDAKRQASKIVSDAERQVLKIVSDAEQDGTDLYAEKVQEADEYETEMMVNCDSLYQDLIDLKERYETEISDIEMLKEDARKALQTKRKNISEQFKAIAKEYDMMNDPTRSSQYEDQLG